MTSFDEGGLTFSANFISEAREATPNRLVSISGQAAIITGEDGVRYFIGGGESKTSSGNGLRIYNADTGALVFDPAVGTIRSDAEGIGVEPPSGWIGSAMTLSFAVAIPETPYFALFVATGAATDIDRGVLWYKINSSSLLEIVGGYAGERSGTTVQFSPSGGAATGLGFLLDQGVSGVNNTVPYKYPLVVGYTGESRSTIFVIPSINQILAETPLTENLPKTPGSWTGKELRLGDIGLDASAFLTNNLPSAGSAISQRSRMFVLPKSDGNSLAAIMWYTADLEAYAAGTASVANTFLTANASTYETGLITTVEVTTTPDSTIFGFTPSLSAVTTAYNDNVKTFAGGTAFPFDDDKEEFDGTPTTALNAYYGNPSLYPSDLDDPTQPWFVFWPKMDRVTRDEIGIRVFEWDPVNETMKQLDSAFGQVFTLGVDVAANTDVYATSVNWDRTTGTLTLLMRSTESGFNSFVVSEFGTFSPIPFSASSGVNDPEEFRLRGWAFEQDGHEFYVLRLGQVGTYIYDRVTQQWSQWLTGSDVNWDAAVGRNWNNYVVAGALEDPYLWSVSPDVTLDNEGVVDGDIPITRTVTGLVSIRGRDRVSCGAVRITASVGDPDIVNATMSLRFSDDYGNTFSSPQTITMSATDKMQDLSFRSLGSMRAPGRLFEVSDIGGATRIDDAIIETDE